jgi:hypothetical protein
MRDLTLMVLALRPQKGLVLTVMAGHVPAIRARTARGRITP